MSLQSGKLHSGYSDNKMLPEIIDPDLDSRLKSLYKAELELKEILEDPFLEQTRNLTASMIDNRDNLQRKKSCEATDFIRNSLKEEPEKARIIREIRDFKIEITKSDINDISAEWVREWHTKKQMQAKPSSSDSERKKFVTSSLDPEPLIATAETPVNNCSAKDKKRKLPVYFALAAAAVLGLFITLNTLVPSSKPEDIFNSFYTPYSTVSQVTRGMGAGSASVHSGSNELFFLGLSQLEKGNINSAIGNLSSVINNSGSYVKEARWYLGLAYLKNKDSKKAADCFSILAATDGYYRDPSIKILRRLK